MQRRIEGGVFKDREPVGSIQLKGTGSLHPGTRREGDVAWGGLVYSRQVGPGRDAQGSAELQGRAGSKHQATFGIELPATSGRHPHGDVHVRPASTATQGHGLKCSRRLNPSAARDVGVHVAAEHPERAGVGEGAVEDEGMVVGDGKHGRRGDLQAAAEDGIADPGGDPRVDPHGHGEGSREGLVEVDGERSGACCDGVVRELEEHLEVGDSVDHEPVASVELQDAPTDEGSRGVEGDVAGRPLVDGNHSCGGPDLQNAVEYQAASVAEARPRLIPLGPATPWQEGDGEVDLSPTATTPEGDRLECAGAVDPSAARDVGVHVAVEHPERAGVGQGAVEDEGMVVGDGEHRRWGDLQAAAEDGIADPGGDPRVDPHGHGEGSREGLVEVDGERSGACCDGVVRELEEHLEVGDSVDHEPVASVELQDAPTDEGSRGVEGDVAGRPLVDGNHSCGGPDLQNAVEYQAASVAEARPRLIPLGPATPWQEGDGEVDLSPTATTPEGDRLECAGAVDPSAARDVGVHVAVEHPERAGVGQGAVEDEGMVVCHVEDAARVNLELAAERRIADPDRDPALDADRGGEVSGEGLIHPDREDRGSDDARAVVELELQSELCWSGGDQAVSAIELQDPATCQGISPKEREVARRGLVQGNHPCGGLDVEGSGKRQAASRPEIGTGFRCERQPSAGGYVDRNVQVGPPASRTQAGDLHQPRVLDAPGPREVGVHVAAEKPEGAEIRDHAVD